MGILHEVCLEGMCQTSIVFRSLSTWHTKNRKLFLSFFGGIKLTVILIDPKLKTITLWTRFHADILPATAVQSISGAYASPHLHGERGCLLVWGMVHGFQQKGGVFERESPLIFKKTGYFYKVLSIIVNLNFNHVIFESGKSCFTLQSLSPLQSPAWTSV